KLTRAAFAMLSKEESRHIDTIETLAKFLDGNTAAPEIDSSPTPGSLEKTIHTIYSTASPDDLDGNMDPAEAYATAIDLEERATALYKQCALECDTAEGRHLFDVLSREEMDHLKLLKDMQGYLADPEQWFVDRKMILREDD
ncbi:ferritin family protein, partial [bacterium]|nr:ferritin family protein [bacterium]